MHISPCWHRNSCPHSSSCSQSYEKMHDVSSFSFLLPSVQFFCPSSVVHMWTPLLCIDLDPAAGSLKISAWLFALLVYLGLEWVQWGVFIISCFILSFMLWYGPSSAVHPPSKDRAPSLRFSPILCRMNLWWLEMSKFSSSSLCWTPLPPSQYSVGKWTATKSFLAIILFLALCRQPHSVLRKLCVKEWLPVSSPER